MKITNFRKAVASALVAGGLMVSGSEAMAVDHFVGDPSFEQIGLGMGNYYFHQGPPNSPFWKDHANSTGKNRAYNTTWATVDQADAPDPRTGSQAVDGEGAYNYQVLDDVFVAGRTYTYTAFTQGWANNTSDANDRFWLYLFAGVDGNDADSDPDDAPGDEGAGGNLDGGALVRAAWHQNGVIDSLGKTGAGAHSFLPFTGFNRDAGSAWTQIGLSYTATAADAGKRIGLGYWANALGAVDDIGLSSVPEPTAVILLGIGLAGGGLLVRRRRDG